MTHPSTGMIAIPRFARNDNDRVAQHSGVVSNDNSRSQDTTPRNVETVMHSRINAARGRTIFIALLSAVAAACSDSTSPTNKTPAAIAAVSGTGQSGAVGSTLASPVVFEVTTA